MPHYVYALIDPRSDVVEYVGITGNFLMRFYQHMGRGENNRSKSEWIQSLVSCGLLPSFKILETLDDREEAQQREMYWIEYYGGKGTGLLNKVKNRNPVSCRVGNDDERLVSIPVEVIEDECVTQALFIKKQFRTRVKQERSGLVWNDDKYILTGIDWQSEWERYRSSPATYQYEGPYIPQPLKRPCGVYC